MNKLVVIYLIATSLAGVVRAQNMLAGDTLGVHDLSPGGISPVKGTLSPCLFCHAPHSGLGAVNTPLWDQKLSSTFNYSLYNSPTEENQAQEPTLGSDASLCLSCHDGTVAPGTTVPYGTIKMKGTMNSQDVFGTNLSTGHPFNFKLPLNCNNDNLLASLCRGTTGNPAVTLQNGNVQCTTCHDPHIQGRDPVQQDFLVMSDANSALCLACHVSTPSANAQNRGRQMSNLGRSGTQIDSSLGGFAPPVGAGGNTGTVETSTEKYPVHLSSWYQSIHAVASHKVSKSARMGPYGILRENGCLSCHESHNARGQGALLTGPVQPVPNMDATTQSCVNCHGGASNLTPPIPNVFAEFAKTNGHPLPSTGNAHISGESVILDNNRHATCTDCHDPHAAVGTKSFASTSLRGSQNGALGASATDGVTILDPASYQYETCLRCHGTSKGKRTLTRLGYLPTRVISANDPLNIISQFDNPATSAHPVMRDSNSRLPQPSLLQFIWNLDGKTQGRAMGTRILCTDCHNSDDDREFGGNGPNGPHGSQYSHILERRYEFSQVAPAAGPGSTILNLFPDPVLDPACNSYPCASPYALCAKCHNLNNLLTNASFAQHARHIRDGFSCSVCHTAHGVAVASSASAGLGLVNFDARVVGSNGGVPVSYSPGTNSCVLTCHNTRHNSDGTVSGISSKTGQPTHMPTPKH